MMGNNVVVETNTDKEAILFTGSRDWNDIEAVKAVLASLDHQKYFVLHGACPSGLDKVVDTLACDEETSNFNVVAVPARWDLYGPAAGPIRNQYMVEHYKPAHVYAFKSSPVSAGTDNCIKCARAAGIPVTLVPTTQKKTASAR